MQVLVKTPHTRIKAEGDIPNNLIRVLQKEFGNNVRIIENQNDSLISLTELESQQWVKEIKSKLTLGKKLKFYRENKKLTQKKLAKELEIASQYLSDLENDRKNISLKMAKKLSKIFSMPITRFIDS